MRVNILFFCFNALLSPVTHCVVAPAAPPRQIYVLIFFIVIVSIYT